ncbi:hypothetical protein F443_20013 [Phytophthora nicotianae P1569]|uniref:RxLR effector protein n=2 Tax=Phytophthora nicotianae TaxID=4792 RepID=V9E2F1_PHYNI|nr:hypothetical protein F443_20013 [Phytophthora nicotianae P1569]
MRVYFIVLLVVVTLVASTGALPTLKDSRRAIPITSIGDLRSRTANENRGTNRSLRKEESVDESVEEQMSTSQFSSVEKVLERVPSSEKNVILEGLKHLSSDDTAAMLKNLASLERLEVTLNTGKVPSIIKNFSDNKFWRILQYNHWIFSNKTPEWVKENFPAFAKGFEKFYDNWMTWGYKYA